MLRSMGGGLTQLTGPDSDYAGISQLCRLSESQSYRLAVCIPMADYRRLVFPAICRCCSSAFSSPFSWCSAA